jgi:3-oxoacyl-(acyl-carrier-protein) synthase
MLEWIRNIFSGALPFQPHISAGTADPMICANLDSSGFLQVSSSSGFSTLKSLLESRRALKSGSSKPYQRPFSACSAGFIPQA